MRVLIVEDDENKERRLTDYLCEVFPEVSVSVAKSFQTGLRAVIREQPDLVLLDMTMPTFDITTDDDGGRPQAYAGREVLRHLDARGLAIRCLVVTQFDRFGDGPDAMTSSQLDALLHRDHPATYAGMVSFDIITGHWQEVLGEAIRREWKE